VYDEPLWIEDGLELPASAFRWEFSRSGGPGGQHVQMTDTRVRLRFDLAGSGVLNDRVKARLAARHPGWITSEGELVLVSSSFRSRHQNVAAVRERLAEAVRASLREPKVRRPTRPSTGSKERRLEQKKAQGRVKALRRAPED
jgi:ribosome-associated protein